MKTISLGDTKVGTRGLATNAGRLQSGVRKAKGTEIARNPKLPAMLLRSDAFCKNESKQVDSEEEENQREGARGNERRITNDEWRVTNAG